MNKWKPKLAPFRKYKKQVFSRASSVADFIYQIGEYPQLRLPSKDIPVSKITSKTFQQKTKYLKSCLLKYRKLTGFGRGITAVQVGIPECFSVIYTEEKLIIIINPKITAKSKQLLKYPEICMSANPVIIPTIRPAWIEFDYYDEEGKLNHWDTKDDLKSGRIMNRVFQHEIDHMEGIINLDRGNPKEFILESDPKFYINANFKKVS